MLNCGRGLDKQLSISLVIKHKEISPCIPHEQWQKYVPILKPISVCIAISGADMYLQLGHSECYFKSNKAEKKRQKQHINTQLKHTNKHIPPHLRLNLRILEHLRNEKFSALCEEQSGHS